MKEKVNYFSFFSLSFLSLTNEMNEYTNKKTNVTEILRNPEYLTAFSSEWSKLLIYVQK